jgi:putative N6-adenine-specific DNA methylase
VAFTGRWPDAWRASWRLSVASRVLVELASWPASTAEQLAQGAQRLVEGEASWDGMSSTELFDPGRTFAVRSTSTRSQLRDTRWISLRTKDGLVDGQRRRYGRRASVSRRAPDLHLRLRLAHDRATLLVDLAGESLDHRGYREATGAAPVREQLAAACVLASGWDGSGPVVDPMCGSGTLLAEAGAYALGLAPGRRRAHWALEYLPSFDSAAWEAIRREPMPAPARSVRLYGVDRCRQQVAAASANLERAGLGEHASLEIGDAFRFAPPAGPGLLLVNPPYGERVTEAAQQWPRLGDLLKQRYTGWRAVVLAGDRDRGKHVGLRPKRRMPVRNGPLDARILVFDLY